MARTKRTVPRRPSAIQKVKICRESEVRHLLLLLLSCLLLGPLPPKLYQHTLELNKELAQERLKVVNQDLGSGIAGPRPEEGPGGEGCLGSGRMCRPPGESGLAACLPPGQPPEMLPHR
ncbi:hypothetical protein LIER_40619 [Lithospermum erythrorhizon]|uniref:Uncharacterized protein n=1 Tax=Lithospermum erythrorhizon TaxID=34254 RepID=A0AAV3QX52_LITER